jgi:hypothetical protein
LFILYHGCGNPIGSDENCISIDWISIQNGDTLNPGTGVLVRFSNAIDLNSFKAQNIQKSVEIIFDDSTGLTTITMHFNVYRIESAAHVLVNGRPLTFWYDPQNFTMALFEETTIVMPFGTGEGLILDQDPSEFIFKSAISAKNGAVLGEDFIVSVHLSNNPFPARIVPNPAFPVYTTKGLQYPSVRFMQLPLSVQINIFDLNHYLMRSLEYQGGGIQQWDLTRDNGTMIEPGIYPFEIFENLRNIKGGIFVFPAGL